VTAEPADQSPILVRTQVSRHDEHTPHESPGHVYPESIVSQHETLEREGYELIGFVRQELKP